MGENVDLLYMCGYETGQHREFEYDYNIKWNGIDAICDRLNITKMVLKWPT
jgi:hypothetical protein